MFWDAVYESILDVNAVNDAVCAANDDVEVNVPFNIFWEAVNEFILDVNAVNDAVWAANELVKV